VIREHRAEAERERHLSPPVLAALHDAGLLRLCTPRALGRLEADPLTRALAIEEISGHDTAAGWTLANPLDQAYLCARLPDAGAEETRGRGANVVIAGQFGRPLQAAPAQEEYRITGRAPFVSVCHDANWIATEAAVVAGDHSRAADQGEPAVVMAYLPRDSCHVLDTWHVMGRHGTGSYDVAVTDVFVPTARTFPFVPAFAPGSHYQGPSTGSPSSALPRPISLRSPARWRGALLRWSSTPGWSRWQSVDTSEESSLRSWIGRTRGPIPWPREGYFWSFMCDGFVSS
jgi:indole-3-acetate monooxygenase